MARQSIFSEFFAFLKAEKKWWMIPLVVLFALIAGALVVTQMAGPLAPFLYPML